MSIKLGSNITSLKLINQLGRTTDELSRVSERLSSGLRINRASDDPGGLLVASKLSTDRRVYGQALRNVNDGISLLSVADSAVDALTGIVTRQMELAEQAANGTYSFSQRKAMNAEANALQEEFNRIVASTDFNGINLFVGSGTNISIQAGYGQAGVIDFTIGSELANSVGTGTFASYFTHDQGTHYDLITTDVNSDGKLDLISVNSFLDISLGNGDGTFKEARTYIAGPSAVQTAVRAADVNGDGFVDLLSTNGVDGLSVNLGNGDGTFKIDTRYALGNVGAQNGMDIGDVNGDGKLDVVVANRDDSTISTLLGNGDGTFKAQIITTLSPTLTRDPELADFNMDGILDVVVTENGHVSVLLGNGNGTFKAGITVSNYAQPQRRVEVGDFNNDGFMDMVVSVNTFPGTGTLSVIMGNGNGTFKAGVTYTITSSIIQDLEVGDVNGDGEFDIFAVGRYSSVISILTGRGDGTFDAQQTVATVVDPEYVSVGDLNGDGVNDIVTATYAMLSTSPANIHLAITSQSTNEPTLRLFTPQEAQSALTTLDGILERLSLEKANIGAAQSRLEVAYSMLQAHTTALVDAESRIIDADVADEVANLVRLQVLQQASTAILAQANLQPGVVLSLLKQSD
jgi:flagellin-like hook-associated protein FlgL